MISYFLSLFTAIPMLIAVQLPVVPRADDSFASDINRTFEMLKKESPALYQHLEKMPREELIQTVLTALDTGVELKTAKPAAQKVIPAAGKRFKYYPARLINGNSIFYARIDNINPATLDRLKSDVETSSRLANKPCGVIIDLRNADRGNYALCMKYLPFFQSQKPDKEKTHFQKIPMVILTGFRTSGAPELLAALLGKSKSAMILGTKGAGKLFPVKEVTFEGKKWLVPQMDTQWDLSADENTPDVEFNPYPQIPYEEIGKKDLRATDDAIRRACDLLKTITVLQ